MRWAADTVAVMLPKGLVRLHHLPSNVAGEKNTGGREVKGSGGGYKM